MQELDILKWAAGSRRRLPPVDATDLDLLLKATMYHGLPGRFLRRLRTEPQNWTSATLLEGLKEVQADTRRNVQMRMEATVEIFRAYCSSRRQAVHIKGGSNYLLTGDPATMRWSEDIDIVCDAQELFRRTLSSLGYTMMQDVSAMSSTHSPGDMHRNDIHVDPHKFFPVLGFPTLREGPNSAEAHGGEVWNNTFDEQHHRVQLSDLLRHSMLGVAPEARKLVIPDPSMAVFLECANTFRDFATRIPWAIGALSLGKLAEICDLVGHPRFSREDFLGIVDRFGGDDSVLFVGDLLERYFSFNPLPSLPPTSSGRREWMFRHAKFFWLPAPWSPDDLLIRSVTTTPVEALVNHLGANRVVAGVSTPGRVYAALAPGKGEALERVITQNPGGKQFPFQFSANWRKEALVIDVSLLEPPSAIYESVRVDIDEFHCYWMFKNPERISWTDDHDNHGGEMNVSFGDSGVSVHFVFPWDSSWALSPRQESIPMMVSAMKRGADHLAEPLSGTLVPMKVVRG